MKVKARDELKNILDEHGFQYEVVHLYGDPNNEYFNVCSNSKWDYQDIMWLWKNSIWPERHLTVCNIDSYGHFCIGVVDNWDELDSYARHYILMMGG